jgi:hypothetical protein
MAVLCPTKRIYLFQSDGLELLEVGFRAELEPLGDLVVLEQLKGGRLFLHALLSE